MRVIRTFSQALTGSLETSHNDQRGTAYDQFPFHGSDQFCFEVSFQGAGSMTISFQTSSDEIDTSASATASANKWHDVVEWDTATPKIATVATYEFSSTQRTGTINFATQGRKLRVLVTGTAASTCSIVMYPRRTYLN